MTVATWAGDDDHGLPIYKLPYTDARWVLLAPQAGLTDTELANLRQDTWDFLRDLDVIVWGLSWEPGLGILIQEDKLDVRLAHLVQHVAEMLR